MKRDIRKLFSEDSKLTKEQMPEGHEGRFIQKLDSELPENRSSSFFFLKIAAGLVVLFGLGYAIFTQVDPETTTPEIVDVENKKSQIQSLGDISPDLKKVENYYLASINMELAKMKYTPENMGLIDGYLKRLSDLNSEYELLNEELAETGPNLETVDALVNNLKLRLNLLQRLKDQLNELNTKNNETTI